MSDGPVQPILADTDALIGSRPATASPLCPVARVPLKDVVWGVLDSLGWGLHRWNWTGSDHQVLDACRKTRE